MTTTPGAEKSRLDPEPVPRRDLLGLVSLWTAASALLFSLFGMLRLPRAAVLASPSKKFRVTLPETLISGAAACSATNGLPGLRRQLSRMVEVVDDVYLRSPIADLRELFQQSGIVEHAIGVEGHHLAANPDDPHVRYGGDITQDLLQTPRGEHQRVTAREQHVRDLLVFLDVRQASAVVERRISIVVHEEAFAETVPAVRSTHLVDQQERGVAVLVLAAADGGVGRLA